MDRLLTVGEVAKIFRVDPQTAARWGRSVNGKPPKLPSVRTPGGHLRFRETDVMRAFRVGETVRHGD